MSSEFKDVYENNHLNPLRIHPVEHRGQCIKREQGSVHGGTSDCGTPPARALTVSAEVTQDEIHLVGLSTADASAIWIQKNTTYTLFH